MTTTMRGMTMMTGRWTATPPPCLHQHVNDEEGDGHNDKAVTRVRATVRGTGKTRGMMMAATPPPPPCTMRGMRMMWRGMMGTTTMTTRTATTITTTTMQRAWQMPPQGDDDKVEVVVGTVR